MPIKKYKPTTNGRRNMTVIDYSVLSKVKPEKSLLEILVKKAGRNNEGKITTRHKGSGHKRKYRLIDFKRNKDNIFGTVKTIEYDPNRNAFISLINYIDGEKRYILAPKNLPVGSKIISGDETDIKIGNCLKLKNIPDGTIIHNIELYPKNGGKIVRSAGTKAQLISKDENGKYVVIRMSSGEIRKILSECRATIGEVSNGDHSLVNLGKAGRNRWKGIRPTVRGSAMNPNDHPHGGGEGKSPIGRKTPMTPWGKKAFGIKTRNSKKASSKLIVRRRNANKK